MGLIDLGVSTIIPIKDTNKKIENEMGFIDLGVSTIILIKDTNKK